MFFLAKSELQAADDLVDAGKLTNSFQVSMFFLFRNNELLFACDKNVRSRSTMMLSDCWERSKRMFS